MNIIEHRLQNAGAHRHNAREIILALICRRSAGCQLFKVISKLTISAGSDLLSAPRL